MNAFAFRKGSRLKNIGYMFSTASSNYYEVLELSKTCSIIDIKKAYISKGWVI